MGSKCYAILFKYISLWYACNDADAVYLCGDFNVRVGNGKDIIEGLDGLDLPDRKVLDATKNSHGDALLEFMRDMKLCILNGRLDPNRDNFTFHSTRGQSVVDYFIVPHDCISHCRHMKVQLTNTVITNYNLSHLISERCRPPDHSVLTLKFTCSSVCDLEHDKDDYRITGDRINKEKHVGQGLPKKCLFKNVPIEFFNIVMWKNALDTISPGADSEN